MQAPQVNPTRERIVDAAAAVMREKGLANATTKAIAAAAGYSEALLYKHFGDKQELFLAVLRERLPQVQGNLSVGEGRFDESLAAIVEQLLAFFVESFPIAASIFSEPNLLRQHREGVESRGFGPEGPVLMVKSYLDTERRFGRVAASADTETAARMLVGFAFHRAFLSAYEGETSVPETRRIARAAVALVLPALV